MSMGTSILSLLGRRDPREKLLQVAGDQQPAAVTATTPGAQYPAAAEPEGGIYATQAAKDVAATVPAQPVEKPQPEAYQSPAELLGMYKELMEYNNKAANIDRGIGLLGSAFAHPENRANIMSAFSPQSSSDLSSMDPATVWKNIQEIQAADVARTQRAAMMAQLPMIAKKYGIDDATAQMLFQSDQLDDFVAEREKLNNSRGLEDSKLANDIVLEGTKANLDIEKNPGVTYHTVGGQLFQFDRKGQKLAVFGDKEMPDLEFREVDGQVAAFDKKTAKEVMRVGTPDSAYETITNGDGTTMIVLKSDPSKVIKTIGTPKNQQTDDQKEFDQAQKDPAFGQWLLDMKRASRSQVNVNTNESSEFQKALDKKRAEDYISLQNKAMNSRQMQGQYDLVEKALTQGDLRTGFGAETELALRKVYSALGGDGDVTKIAAGDLFKSVQNQLAMMKRNPESGLGLPGSVSDRDLQFLKDADINLTAGLEGNKLMLQAARRLNNRNVEVAKMASDYLEKNGRLDAKFDQMIQEYADANPLFADMDIKPLSVEEKRKRAAAKFGVTLDGN